MHKKKAGMNRIKMNESRKLYEYHQCVIFKDRRGFVANTPWNEIVSTLCNIHIFSLNKNCTRGNHLHPKRDEWLFILNGKAKINLSYENIEEEIILDATEGKWLLIYPNVIHTIETISEETTYWFAGSRCFKESEEPDTIKAELL